MVLTRGRVAGGLAVDAVAAAIPVDGTWLAEGLRGHAWPGINVVMHGRLDVWTSTAK
jgi:hypothetical protein